MKNITELTLVYGVGNYSQNKACLMSAAVAKIRLEKGEPLGKATDDLACVDGVIRSLAIKVNDTAWWKSDTERTEKLLPLIDLIIGTTKSRKLTLKRAYKCADVAVRFFTADALEKAGLEDQAKILRELPEICSVESARVARDVAAGAAYAAYAAYAAAWDAAYAAKQAAEWAAGAAARAADMAAYAAYAAAGAAGAARYSSNRDACIQLLIDLCEMK